MVVLYLLNRTKNYVMVSNQREAGGCKTLARVRVVPASYATSSLAAAGGMEQERE